MEELAQQKAEIEARLSEAPADMPDVHPHIAEHYRAEAIRLAETLAEPESNREARDDIRSLIGEVVITPSDKRGESHAILRGELMAILDVAAGRRRSPKPEVIANALEGPRFEPTIRQASEFRRNIADLRRVGKSGGGFSLPDFYDLARLPSIICDPSRSMVAPRQRERMSRPIPATRLDFVACSARPVGHAEISVNKSWPPISP
jgi:hypothetical protein